jgi:hydroxypyruvate isomerase
MARIKQSFSWWCFENRGVPDERLLQEAAAMGYQGVDLLPNELWETARSVGLVITNGLGPRPLEKGFNQQANHGWLKEEIYKQLEASARHNVPTIIVFSGNRAGISDEEGLANTVLGLRQVIPMAEKLGVTLLLELLNSKIDHPDYQCDRTTWGVAVCKIVASPNLKLLYDIYHMQIMEGDVIRTLRDNLDHVGHIHTAGVPGREDLDEQQELFYPGIVRALGEAGYKGYLGHEFLPKGDPLKSLRSAFQLCDIDC